MTNTPRVAPVPASFCLLNSRDLQKALRVSRETLNDLLREGMPVISLHSVVAGEPIRRRMRFEYQEVLNWLRRRQLRVQAEEDALAELQASVAQPPQATAVSQLGES